jgi:hypothetical protein
LPWPEAIRFFAPDALEPLQTPQLIAIAVRILGNDHRCAKPFKARPILRIDEA